MSCNVNGLRSATSKGFLEWMRRQKPDVLCLQEVRAEPDQLPRKAAVPRGFEARYFSAQKKGYSGVAIWSVQPPLEWSEGIGRKDWDAEGRMLRADFGRLSVISLYIPSGSSGDERQRAKYRFMARLFEWLRDFRASGRSFVITGDWNIAHRELDLKNFKSNVRNSGFLPDERAWLGQILDELELVDVFRRLEPERRVYTWWSNRGRAFEKDVGWRLDYQLATPDVAETATSWSVYRRRRFSDHAPLTIDYRFEW
ncbi:MAG: exodeoxyribonuclease III [Myxococcota bacterium]